MSKRIFKMIVPIEGGRGSRKNTNNIHKYINKVTCDVNEWTKPSEAVRFVEEELEEYPFSEESEAIPKREEILRIHLKQNYLKEKVVRLLKLSLKLEKKISFLELQ